jgi:hypothetical protein
VDSSQTCEAVKKPEVRVRSSSFVDQFQMVDPMSLVTTAAAPSVELEVIPRVEKAQTSEAVRNPEVRVRSSSLVDQFQTVDPMSEVTGNPA